LYVLGPNGDDGGLVRITGKGTVMSKRIQPIRVNHPNMVLEDYDASLAHFKNVYGAEFLLDLNNPNWHACLINIGDVIFELFAPNLFLLNARYGAHYLGIEYQADMTVVREVLKARNIRIERDIDVAVHTHPKDCLGISFEFWNDQFHQNEAVLGMKMKLPAYWRDEHPLGMTGQKGYTVVVADMDKARRFMDGFMENKVVYETARPEIGARAVGLQTADVVMELLTPTGEGEIKRHLAAFGDGIRSIVFGVQSIDTAKKYFAERNVKLVPGTAPGTVAVPAEANMGVIFEFAA
jgi:hypothetical protein